jgi:ABC-type dipeptide/oligopeptide/nickel transport system permease component
VRITPWTRRLLARLAALWLVVTITFFALHAMPGQPFADPELTAAARARLLTVHGLGRPLLQQYLAYLAGLLRGRLGHSLVDTHEAVAAIVARGLPVSAALGGEALLWSVSGGLVLGLWAALGRGGWPDRLVLALAVVGLAVPNFVVAVVVDYVFGVRLGWLPVAGWGGFAASVLPAFSLGLGCLALVARVLRARAAEVLAMEHVAAARAKGLGPVPILLRHVLRNALVPVVTLLGPLAAGVVTGSFVVEEIFAIPGIGAAYVNAVLDRDYPVVLGITVVYAVVLFGFNLLVDVAYALLDPRVRVGEADPLG